MSGSIVPKNRLVGGKAPYRLIEEIVARSVAGTWAEAKLEWTVDRIVRLEEPWACLCGHFPILKRCFIRNRKNGFQVVVGSCCVEKFLDIPAQALFRAVERIKENEAVALKAKVIECAYRVGWITDYERGFGLDTWRKRRLSPRQLAKRIEINLKVLARATGAPGRAAPCR
jgi:hypothetical protein